MPLSYSRSSPRFPVQLIPAYFNPFTAITIAICLLIFFLSSEKSMRAYTDQVGRQVRLKALPRRIISVVPSQTELLADLGLEDEVVGITRFCIHPNHWFREKKRVGGTKQLDKARIDALQPDLIIANKEENVQAQIEELAEDYPVWVSDVHDLESACRMIAEVGGLTGTDSKARDMIQLIEERFAGLLLPSSPLRAAYLIWKDPYMTVGGDTFISYMLMRAGLINIYNDKRRYPEISLEELASRQPEVVLLSSEPYPFGQKHREALGRLLPGTAILLVDGGFFSWYGSRLLRAPAYFSILQQQLPISRQ